VAKEETSKKDDIVSKLEKDVAKLKAKVGQMSENWKSFCKEHLGSEADDGKIGSVRAAVLGLFLMGVVVGAAWAADFINYPQPDGTAGFSVSDAGNVTAAGTITITGAATFSSTIDADSFTADAGAGLDNQAAGALLIGAATATSVEIGDAGVTTDIQGPVTILGTTGAGLDTAGATALFIAEATATSLSLGAADIDTISLGRITVLEGAGEGLDTIGAGILLVGEATATGVTLGASDADVIVSGDLDVVSRISSGHLTTTTAGPTDNLSVVGVNVIFCNGASATVVIGGFVGGIAGQVLYLTSIETANGFTLENAEAGGSQDIFLSAEGDVTVATKGGGFTLVCDGTSWFEVSK